MRSALIQKIGIVISLLIISVTLSGCSIPFFGKDDTTDEAPVELTMWGLWEPQSNVQSLIDKYHEAHPNVTIKYEERQPKFYFDTLKSRLISELSPDIVRVHNTWVVPLSKLLAPMPDTLMSTDSFSQTFYQTAQESLIVNGKILGLPLMVDGLALIYNQKLFDEAGISTAPETWDQFRETAKKLTKRDESGAVTQAGSAFGFAGNVEHFSDIVGLLMAQNGAQFEDPSTGALTFHNTLSSGGRNLGAEALSFYTLFSGDEQVWNPNWGLSTEEFIAGKVAMIFVPSWRIINIYDAISGQTDLLPFKVARVPQLLPLKEAEGKNWASYWVESVSARSKNSAVAWDFLNWLSAQEQSVDLYKNQSATRLFGEPYSRIDLASSLLEDQYLSPYVAQAPTATSWYFASRTQDTSLNDAMIDLLASAVDSVRSGTSAEAALSTLAEEAQAVFKQL